MERSGQSREKVVSIIIPTYNRSKLLARTLESIRQQSVYKPSIEVIVVDDGSSDDTEATARSFNPYFPVRYLFQEDKGYRVASARNLGIKNASGDVLLFVDSGVVLGPECVASHLQTHRSGKRPAAVIGYIFGLQENVGDLQTIVDMLGTDESILHCKQHRRFLDIREEVYEACNWDLNALPAPWVLFWTGNVSVQRKVLAETGVFDVAFDSRWGMEDIELGYRLHLSGVRFVVDPNASSIHYPHHSDTAQKLQQELVNKIYFNSKYNTPETMALLESTTVTLNLRLLEKETKEVFG
jgi:glycosyltransferase involved in cell wall biosynthesis